jgi:hypothetical protein
MTLLLQLLPLLLLLLLLLLPTAVEGLPLVAAIIGAMVFCQGPVSCIVMNEIRTVSS